jgi:hypothetical protein
MGCEDDQMELCNSDADCSQASCITCTLPFIGDLQICRDDCEGLF